MQTEDQILAANGRKTLEGERQRLIHETRSRLLKRLAWLEGVTSVA